MSTESLVVRTLTKDDGAKYRQLLHSTLAESRGTLYPDHEITGYNLMSGQDPFIVGAVLGDSDLVGMIGSVPINVGGLPPNISSYYHNDYYIKPEFRGQKILGGMGKSYFEYFNTLESIPLCFAIEATKGGLEILAPMCLRMGIELRFWGTSSLQEIYLINEIKMNSTNEVPVSLDDYKHANLVDMNEAALDRILAAYSHARRGSMYGPVFDRGMISRLVKVDKNARAVWCEKNGKIVAGLMTTDLSQVRRFCYSGKPNAVIDALNCRRKNHGCSALTKGSLLKVLNVCIPFCNQDGQQELKNLIRLEYSRSYQTNYDAMMVRDLEPRLLPEECFKLKIGSPPSVYRYDKRVCLVTRIKDQQTIKQAIDFNGGQSNWHLDSLLL